MCVFKAGTCVAPFWGSKFMLVPAAALQAFDVKERRARTNRSRLPNPRLPFFIALSLFRPSFVPCFRSIDQISSIPLSSSSSSSSCLPPAAGTSQQQTSNQAGDRRRRSLDDQRQQGSNWHQRVGERVWPGPSRAPQPPRNARERRRQRATTTATTICGNSSSSSCRLGRQLSSKASSIFGGCPWCGQQRRRQGGGGAAHGSGCCADGGRSTLALFCSACRKRHDRGDGGLPPIALGPASRGRFRRDWFGREQRRWRGPRRGRCCRLRRPCLQWRWRWRWRRWRRRKPQESFSESSCVGGGGREGGRRRRGDTGLGRRSGARGSLARFGSHDLRFKATTRTATLAATKPARPKQQGRCCCRRSRFFRLRRRGEVDKSRWGFRGGYGKGVRRGRERRRWRRGETMAHPPFPPGAVVNGVTAT